MNTKLENASATRTLAHSMFNQEAIMNRSTAKRLSFSTLRNVGLVAMSASMMMACGTAPAGVPTPNSNPGPSIFTVTGKVVSLTGQPVPSATVQVIGKPSTTTDVNGNFSIPGVSAPYDVAAVASFGPSTVVTLFKGVTRSDPRVIAFALGGGSKSATINGSLSGSLVLPTPVFRRTQMAFVAPEGTDTSNVFNNPYALNPIWFGPNSITGTVHALQWSVDAAGLPTIYRGYGKLENVPVSDGGIANKDVALNAVAGSILSGNVTVPAGLSLSSKRLSADFGPNAKINLVSDSTVGAAFSYNAPNIAGVGLTASAKASGAGGIESEVFKRNLAANANNLNLEIPTPPSLSLPVSGATGIDLTNQAFSWAPFNGGLHIAQLSTPGKAFVVFTAASSVTLPSTASLGLGTLPTGTAFSWRVMGTSAMTSTDAITNPSSGSVMNALAPASDYGTGNSQTHTFATN